MYASIGLWLLVRATRELQSSNGLTFVVGGALLAAASVIDVATHRNYLLEDGAKLIGALVWLTVPLTSIITSHAANQRTASSPSKPLR